MRRVDAIPKMQCEGKGRAVKMKKTLSGPDGVATKYMLSSAAASIAETVTYPLDLTKTRLQIQGEWAAKRANNAAIVTPYRGMLQTALGIVKEEGLRKLWQGVTPAIYRHIVYTGCRMAFYEWIRENILLKRSDGTFSVWKAILGGLFAGGFAQFLASPMDLIKVQMQTEGRRRLEGHAPRVKNTAHAFKKIVQVSGFRGLWKGVVPNVQRAALVNLGDLTTYDTAKHFILNHTQMEDNMLTHASASACSGLVAATMGTPADVIKTRVMNQPIKNGRGSLYSTSMDCLIKTVKMEGFWALYKGFMPCWIRMAPWSMTFWLSYEQIRRWGGVSSF